MFVHYQHQFALGFVRNNKMGDVSKEIVNKAAVVQLTDENMVVPGLDLRVKYFLWNRVDMFVAKERLSRVEVNVRVVLLQ